MLIECPICFDEKSEYTTFPCGHQVCMACEKLLIESKHDNCPLCRTPVGVVVVSATPDIESNNNNTFVSININNSINNNINNSIINDNIIDDDVLPPIRPRNRSRRHRDPPLHNNNKECFGNVFCAFLVLFLMIIFFFTHN